MLFQDAPANTVNYMIAGFAVIFSAMIAYVISLVVRWKRLEGEAEELEAMEKRG